MFPRVSVCRDTNVPDSLHKKATKFVVIFPSPNDLNRALNVGVCHRYFIKLFMNTLI